MKRSNMGVKILFAKSWSDLEVKVNEWLELGDEKDHLIYSIAYHPGDKGMLPSVFITYDINQISSE